MDFTQLQTFLTVVEAGSFSAASQQLHSVQSNVTARIRKLEDSVGGKLFERGRQGARLTPLGQQLKPHAEDILGRVAEARARLRHSTTTDSPLRLGSMETTAGSRLPRLLIELGVEVPRAAVTLTTGPSASLMRQLWARELDAAFMVGPVDKTRFNAVHAFDETLLLVRAANRESRNAEAADKVLLSFADGCAYRNAAMDWLRATGRPDVTIRVMSSLDTILGCVGAGMGFAVVPNSALMTYNDIGLLDYEPLPMGFHKSETILAWRRDQPHGQALQCLILLLSSQ